MAAHKKPAPSPNQELEGVPAATSPIVSAALQAVKAVAPRAEAIACGGRKPRSPSMMWKLTRFAIAGKVVVTVGTFTKHASLFFARGAELADEGGVLEGAGKKLRYITLRTPLDAKRAAVKAVLRQAFALERAPKPTPKKAR